MFAPFRYSPLPLTSYQPPDSALCGLQEIRESPQSAAIWNLFWLTCPEVDTLAGAGPGWAKHYRPMPDVLAAVVADVTLDEVLFRRVMSRPEKFAAWWCRQDYSIFDTYYYLGPKWPVTVLERAHDAITRMKPERSRT